MPDELVLDMADRCEELAKLPLGGKVSLSLGGPMADLFLVERLHSPTLFLRFRVLLHGCEIAEVVAERDHEGAWACEEL